MKAPNRTWASRLAIASRVAAAVFGGYVLAVVASIALASVLPGSRADRVFGAIQLSFAIYTGAVIWVFAARTATQGWLGLSVPAALLGILAWLGA